MATENNSKNGNSQTMLQQEITEFKQELDTLLSGESDRLPSSSILVDQVLAYLQAAEAHASTDASRAWHDLEQAKLTLNHERLALDGTDATGQPFNEAAVLLGEIYDIWDELNEVKRRQPYMNTEETVDWLLRARKALNKEDYGHAFYCIMGAKSQLLFAKRCSEQLWLSQILPIFVVLAYIATVVGIALLIGRGTESVMAVSAFAQVIPQVFFWGFLGGVAWCMYSAAQWAKQRLFDWHTLPWYISQPWVSSLLGAAVSLIVLAGLTAVNPAVTLDSLTTPTIATLAIVSFTAGFSTKSMWKLMDRTARRVLRDKPSAQDISRSTQEEVIEATT